MEREQNIRPMGTDNARVVQVIVTHSLEGSGTIDDPCKEQVRYWSFDGVLLAEKCVTETQEGAQ